MLTLYTKVVFLGILGTLCATESPNESRHTILQSPVETYVSTFTKEVKESNNAVLNNVFDLGPELSPDEVSASIFYFVSTYLFSLGDPNAAERADMASKYIKYSVPEITLTDHVRFFSGSLGKFLYSEGDLNEENASNMAKHCAKIVSDVSKKMVNKDYPQSKLTALNLGFKQCLTTQSEFTAVKGVSIARIVGDEYIYIAANRTNFPRQKDKCSLSTHFPQDKPNPILSHKKDLCFQTSPEENLFKSSFINAVITSGEPLRNIFDLSDVTVHEFARGAFYIAHFVFAQIGFDKDLAAIAAFMSQSVSGLTDSSLPTLLRINSNFISKILKAKGKLSIDNAKKLAEDIAGGLIAGLGALNLSIPKSKHLAITVGLVSFLLGQHLMEIKDVAFYYGNAYYCEKFLLHCNN